MKGNIPCTAISFGICLRPVSFSLGRGRISIAFGAFGYAAFLQILDGERGLGGLARRDWVYVFESVERRVWIWVREGLEGEVRAWWKREWTYIKNLQLVQVL